EEAILVGVVVINSPVGLVYGLECGQRGEQIVVDSRQVGPAEDEIVIHFGGNRIPAAAGDNISGERHGKCYFAVGSKAARKRIIELPPCVSGGIGSVLRIVELGEIALVHLVGGSRQKAAAAGADICTLVVTEEEQLVFANRTAQGAPKLVAFEG